MENNLVGLKLRSPEQLKAYNDGYIAAVELGLKLGQYPEDKITFWKDMINNLHKITEKFAVEPAEPSTQLQFDFDSTKEDPQSP